MVSHWIDLLLGGSSDDGACSTALVEADAVGPGVGWTFEDFGPRQPLQVSNNASTGTSALRNCPRLLTSMLLRAIVAASARRQRQLRHFALRR